MSQRISEISVGGRTRDFRAEQNRLYSRLDTLKRDQSSQTTGGWIGIGIGVLISLVPVVGRVVAVTYTVPSVALHVSANRKNDEINEVTEEIEYNSLLDDFETADSSESRDEVFERLVTRHVDRLAAEFHREFEREIRERPSRETYDHVRFETDVGYA